MSFQIKMRSAQSSLFTHHALRENYQTFIETRSEVKGCYVFLVTTNYLDTTAVSCLICLGTIFVKKRTSGEKPHNLQVFAKLSIFVHYLYAPL